MPFWRRDPYRPKKTVLRWDLTEILIMIVMTMVVLQGVGLIFGQAFGIDIKLGPAFILIAVGASAVISIAIFKKLLTNQPVDKTDIFAIIVTALVAILLMFFLKDFVPEIFENAVLQLQSMLGF
jgi:hypothetical protein